MNHVVLYDNATEIPGWRSRFDIAVDLDVGTRMIMQTGNMDTRQDGRGEIVAVYIYGCRDRHFLGKVIYYGGNDISVCFDRHSLLLL